MVEGPSVLDRNGNMQNPLFPIQIGIRALRHLYVVYDVNRARIGMSSKLSDGSPTNVQCKEKVPCQGMQSYVSSANACEDPKCHEYFLLQLNDATKTCEFEPGFHAIAVIFVLMFVVIEFSLNYVHEELSKRVHNALVPIEEERDAKDAPPSRQGLEMTMLSQPSVEVNSNVELRPSVAAPGAPALEGVAL